MHELETQLQVQTEEGEKTMEENLKLTKLIETMEKDHQSTVENYAATIEELSEQIQVFMTNRNFKFFNNCAFFLGGI